MLILSSSHLPRPPFSSIAVSDVMMISWSAHTRRIGIIFDQSLSMVLHVTYITCLSFAQHWLDSHVSYIWSNYIAKKAFVKRRTNGRHNSRTKLGPAVHCGKDTTLKTLLAVCNAHTWPQQCWKSCANASNIVALRLGDHGTKELLGVAGSKFDQFQTLRNISKQHATTCNNMQQDVQTDATCLIPQRWELLAKLASVWMGLYVEIWSGREI